ncbi:MAG: polyhydroxyalkanoate synthesis regulator DNA-binding domain-containing protein [Thermoanaerobaculia bacterium]|nr:polyhydroxyalkanoate synthesis regulator DNA-binding domain-containing protein [Thermoanaerobaculia bacterium]
MSEPVIIKRYQNRRLYDTESSSYVNLDHLSELVEQGRSFKVVDAKTGEDLTRRFLTQILIESQKMLPLEVLQQLACATDRAFRDFLNWYLSSAVAVYQQVQEGWQKQLQDLAARRSGGGLGAAGLGFGAASGLPGGLGQLWDPVQVATALRERWTGAGSTPAADEADADPSRDAESDLARRLAALEEKLRRLEEDDAGD